MLDRLLQLHKLPVHRNDYRLAADDDHWKLELDERDNLQTQRDRNSAQAELLNLSRLELIGIPKLLRRTQHITPGHRHRTAVLVEEGKRPGPEARIGKGIRPPA